MNQTVKSAFYSHKRFFYTRGVGGQRKSPPHPTGNRMRRALFSAPCGARTHDLRITRPKLITSRHRDTPTTTPQPHTGALFMPSYPGGYTTESHRQGRQENHALGTTPNRIYHLADSFRKSRIHHRNTHPLDPIPRPHLPTRVRPDRHRKPSNPMARKPELETSHEEKRPAIHPLILSLSHRYRTTRRRPNPPDTLYTTTQV